MGETGMRSNEAANVFTAMLAKNFNKHSEDAQRRKREEEEKLRQEHARRLGF